MIYCESPFEEQVVEFLENSGCTLRCQVGGEKAANSAWTSSSSRTIPRFWRSSVMVRPVTAHTARKLEIVRGNDNWSGSAGNSIEFGVRVGGFTRILRSRPSSLLHDINKARRAAGPARHAAPMGARFASTSTVSH